MYQDKKFLEHLERMKERRKKEKRQFFMYLPLCIFFICFALEASTELVRDALRVSKQNQNKVNIDNKKSEDSLTNDLKENKDTTLKIDNLNIRIIKMLNDKER